MHFMECCDHLTRYSNEEATEVYKKQLIISIHLNNTAIRHANGTQHSRQ
jgi:hypothetical protein